MDFDIYFDRDLNNFVSGGDADEQNCMSYVTQKCTSCPDDVNKLASKQAESAVVDEWWEDVVVKNDANYVHTKRALEITEQFIADNNLILIGGMAIDMALKLVGRHGIYSSEKLPDYDFLSPDTIGHAAKLAHVLCKAHLPNVSAINAMHTTTIKVRCNFTPSADIGYCPRGIYDELPTIKVGRLRVIHPHFQIADIHRSLSYPFDRAQVIGAGLFYRWKKDCTRYDMLLDAYPISCQSGNCEIAKSHILLDKELLKGDCLAGWVAISYWKSVVHGDARLEVPDDQPIQVFTDDFAKYVSRADVADENSIRYFEAIMGHLPRHVKLSIAGQKYEVFDNYGALLSAELVDSLGGIYVANMQHCMLWLIENIYVSARGASDRLKAYCQAQYVECARMVSEGNCPGILPSINVFGSANLDESYLIGRRKFVARLSGAKLQDKDVIDGVYPSAPKCVANIAFDYKKSPYFAISGSQTGVFVKREVPSVGN
jgi:hypothetical protein